MRPASGVLVLLLALPLAAAAETTTPAAAPESPLPVAAGDAARSASIAAARDSVLPYVVSILAVREQFRGGEAQLSLSSGSGTVVTPQGDVVTNAHVTQQGRAFRVVFGDGREFGARLVGEDTLSDLAVLRIEGAPGQVFEHAEFAPALELSPGDTVLAMGAPWGLSNSMSVGVVNNPRRLLVSLFQNEADYESRLGPDLPTGRYYAWIQHDAPIAPGNSGGPLVDLSGRIVGVNARGMIFGGNLAFAIPAPDAAKIVQALIETGEVRRADLGFRLRSLKGTPYARGVLLHAVDRGSPAEAAGLTAGDRLLSLNDQPLDAPEAVDVPGLQQLIAELPVGSRVRLEVEGANDRRPRRVELVAQAYPRDRGQEALFAPFAAVLTELTPAMARRRALQVEEGLLLTGLRAGGPAATARPALRAGDLIQRVDGRKVSRLDDLAPWREPGSDAPRGLRVEVLREGATLLSWLQPRYGDVSSSPLAELSRPWSGAEVQPIPGSLAEPLGLPQPGFRITRLYPGAPLEAAGARVGDLIVALDGESLRPLNDNDETSFQQRVRDLDVGREVPVAVRRNGKGLDLKLVPRPAPIANAALPTLESARLRIKLRALGFYDRAQLRLESGQTGVLVTSVESGGPAGLAHLRDGDVIVAIDGRPVLDLAGFAEGLELALRGSERLLPLHVKRGAESRVLFLDRSWIQD